MGWGLIRGHGFGGSDNIFSVTTKSEDFKYQERSKIANPVIYHKVWLDLVDNLSAIEILCTCNIPQSIITDRFKCCEKSLAVFTEFKLVPHPGSKKSAKI